MTLLPKDVRITYPDFTPPFLTLKTYPYRKSAWDATIISTIVIIIIFNSLYYGNKFTAMWYRQNMSRKATSCVIESEREWRTQDVLTLNDHHTRYNARLSFQQQRLSIDKVAHLTTWLHVCLACSAAATAEVIRHAQNALFTNGIKFA